MKIAADPRLAASCALIAFLALPASADTMSFQADRDTTFISGSVFPNSNFGGADGIPAGTLAPGALQNAILSFDVGVLNGLYASIDSITLRLVQWTGSGVTGFDSSVDVTNRVYPVSAANRGWVEGSGGANGAILAGTSTWNNRLHSSAVWAGSAGLASPSIDYANTLLATHTYLKASPPIGNEMIDFTLSGDLTGLIDTWLVDNVTHSQANPGLLIMDPTPSSAAGRNRMVYFSRNTTNPDFRPRLIVNYTPVASTPLTLKIARGSGGPNRYDFTWSSRTGKVYDLLSSTNLSTSPATWAVFDPDGPGGMAPCGDILATPPTSLLGSVESSSPARFFAVRERDGPPGFSVTVQNHGVGGQNTTEAINNSLPGVLATQPDRLVIYCGLNDALWPIKLVALDAYKANLTSMVNQALAAGVKTVFLVGIHPCNMVYVAQNNPTHPEILRLQDHLTEYHVAVAEVAAATGATFIDWRTRFIEESPGTSIEDAVANNPASLLLCEANSGLRDGIHLTMTANRLLGLRVAQALAPVVASGDLIACMGDSVTYGLYMNGAGTATGDTYPGVLSKTLNP
jgi:lysophospholipase L1-like esterase